MSTLEKAEVGLWCVLALVLCASTAVVPHPIFAALGATCMTVAACMTWFQSALRRIALAIKEDERNP